MKNMFQMGTRIVTFMEEKVFRRIIITRRREEIFLGALENSPQRNSECDIESRTGKYGKLVNAFVGDPVYVKNILAVVSIN